MEGTLIAHCGTEKMNRLDLRNLPVPVGTDTWRPIPHHELTGDLKLSQVQLGHKRLSTTANIYTHVNARQVERAGDILAEAILSTN